MFATFYLSIKYLQTTRSVEYIFFSWCCRFMYAFDVNDTKFLVDIQCWFGQHGQGHQPQSNCFGSFKTLYQKLRAFLCSKQNNIVRCIEKSSIFFFYWINRISWSYVHSFISYIVAKCDRYLIFKVKFRKMGRRRHQTVPDKSGDIWRGKIGNWWQKKTEKNGEFLREPFLSFEITQANDDESKIYRSSGVSLMIFWVFVWVPASNFEKRFRSILSCARTLLDFVWFPSLWIQVL